MMLQQQTSLFPEKTQKQILSLMFAVCLIALLGNYVHSNFAVLGKPAELYNQFFGNGSDASGAANEFLQHPTEYILGGIGEVTSEKIDTITGALKEAHPDKADEIDMWKNRILVFVGGYAVGDGLSGSGKKTGTGGTVNVTKYVITQPKDIFKLLDNVTDITKSSSIKNLSSTTTRANLEKTLVDQGFKPNYKKGSNNITVFEKDGIAYTIRDNAKSTGSTTVDVYNEQGKMVTKIRIGD